MLIRQGLRYNQLDLHESVGNLHNRLAICRNLQRGKEIKPMKRGILKISFAVAVFVILELFILTPAFAKLDCPKLVWPGDYYILTEADLESLSGYTSVTGTLFIHYPTLISLEGLECLTQVGGNLEIYENDSLISLEGLENLKYVGGHMRIRDNDSLTSLEGLEKIKSVGSELEINNNDELCNSLADALIDQLLDTGGIGGLITILDNNDC